MKQNISIAHTPASPEKQPLRLPTRDSSIRRELAVLWVAQTLRNMLIIGLTRTQMREVVTAVLDRWCGGDSKPNEMAPR